MSDQAFVVMPVQADGTQGQDRHQVAAAVQQSLHEKLHPERYQEPEPQDGPLKRAIANQDSLYRYISWEDPVRTLGSYVGLVAILSGVHYLHPTQWALKIAATALGGVSLVSSASRFTKNDFAAQLRPREYKRVPEQTLNATLKDIHDFVQYSVVQVQKILYGEDLQGTVTAFIGATVLFWLIKVVSPFGLAILGLTTLYLAPLVNSPRGREVARDAKIRAQEVAGTTVDNAKALAQNGKDKAVDLSSRAQRTAGDLSNQAQRTAGNASNQAQQTAGNLSNQAQQTAGNLSNQMRGTASDISGATSDNARKLHNVGANGINVASDTARSAVDSSQQYYNDSRFGSTNGQYNSAQPGNHETSSSGVNPNVTVDGVIPKYDQSRF